MEVDLGLGGTRALLVSCHTLRPLHSHCDTCHLI